MWDAIKKDPKSNGYAEFEGEVGSESFKIWVPVNKERIKDHKKAQSQIFDKLFQDEGVEAAG